MLTIERVAGQRPLHEVTAIPRPSQLDDWQLFEKYEGDMIRQRRGDQEFLEWKRAKAEERITIGQWRRTLELRAELKCGTHPRPSKGSLLSQAEVKDGILEAGK